MPESLIILMAFASGLLFRKLGYPPLLGYLLAGFAASYLGVGSSESIAPIADLGITLLLFTIGLKLNLRELIAPQVWAVAGGQMLIAIPLTTAVILLAAHYLPVMANLDTQAAWTLAFALSFSSTVFAVKIFDERGEGGSLHASIAIGILIIQDLIAVAYLVLSSDKEPSIYALGLLALPLLRPVFISLMRMTGHGELFELVHLKAGLGALIAGVLLGSSGKSTELYKSLLNFKDIFLIGFFIQVGYNGLPSLDMLWIALGLSLLIFIRPMIYFFLLVALRLRARTALLSGFSLFNYSEFGLIVAALSIQAGVLPADWLTIIALAMSLSFFIAVPFNTRIHLLYSSLASLLHRFERDQRLPEEQPVSPGNAQILILGMGRVGSGAYDYLQQLYPGNVVGIDDDMHKVQEQQKQGINCVQGDASDFDFWEQIDLSQRTLVLVCLTNHQENVSVVEQVRHQGYEGRIAAVSRFPDQQKELQQMGCIAFNLYAEAGHGFAEHVMDQLVPD